MRRRLRTQHREAQDRQPRSWNTMVVVAAAAIRFYSPPAIPLCARPIIPQPLLDERWRGVEKSEGHIDLNSLGKSIFGKDDGMEFEPDEARYLRLTFHRMDCQAWHANANTAYWRSESCVNRLIASNCDFRGLSHHIVPPTVFLADNLRGLSRH